MNENESAKQRPTRVEDGDHDFDLNANVEAQRFVDFDGEVSLLRALQAYLSAEGKAFSIGALRDLGDPGEIKFTVKSAVQALRQLGYKTSFGKLRARRFRETHLPLIAFSKSGEALLVQRNTIIGQ